MKGGKIKMGKENIGGKAIYAISLIGIFGNVFYALLVPSFSFFIVLFFVFMILGIFIDLNDKTNKEEK